MDRKLPQNDQETPTQQKTKISFHHTRTFDQLFTCFFTRSSELGIELLFEDENWLKSICFGERLTVLQTLLVQYIDKWLTALQLEPVIQKQQNAGRYHANCFIREMLSCTVKNR
jgi:hypothetical protein